MSTQHEERPTFQGRPLPRPDEELVDQGLAFDLGTLISRRNVLRVFGLGAATVGLAACGAGSSSSSSSSSSSATASSAAGTAAAGTTEIPDETAGPFPGDGSNGPDALSQSGIVRSDIRSSFGDAGGVAEGVPTTMTLSLTDIANGGVPFANAAVYVWHCDRDGEYSMYGQSVADENYLRGVQVADAAGVVTFTTVFPACYSGRWPHVHFEVYPDVDSITDAGNAIATSQLALPQDTCDTVYATTGYEQSVRNLAQVSLATDGIFSDDGGVHQIPTVTGSVSSGYALALAVGIDTTTTPSAGSGFGGAGRPPSA